MSMTTRDKRALAGLSIAVAGIGIYLFVSGGDSAPPVVGASDSIMTAERRLARVRQVAAAVQGKQQLLKQATDELAKREKGIIQAATAAQAQAQVLDEVRKVGHAQTPPLEFTGVELQPPAPMGDYGQVRIALSTTCHTEDLVNFLADLTRLPDAIATTEIRINAQNPKEKTISVRLSIAGVVPRSLVPQKKGLAF